MSQAKQGDTVSVHYTGKLDDGTVFDSSKEREPIEFEIGASAVIPGFEKAVIGMVPGESKTAEVPAADGYGEREQDKVVEVQRDQLPSELEVRVGQRLKLTDPQQNATYVTVAEMDEAKITLDANHPLAGRDLLFEIELLTIA